MLNVNFNQFKSGYLKKKNQVLFFDVGGPPSKNFSKNYQSGPLSFEYFLDGLKIITNCGFGNNISPKAELISRLTASQSTLTINDTSITKFERNKLINRVFGNSIKNTFKTSDLKFKVEENLIKDEDTLNLISLSKTVSHRKDDISGIHKVIFTDKDVTYTYTHKAISRDIFGNGALYCAKKVIKLQPDLYTFERIIN